MADLTISDDCVQMDKQHSENMGKLSNNMDKLTKCISDGFSLLQGLIYPHQVNISSCVEVIILLSKVE